MAEDGISTRGSRALARALEERGAQQRLTEEIGCSEGLVNRWMHGTRTPTTKWAVELERTVKIPPRWWTEPANDSSAPPPAESRPQPKKAHGRKPQRQVG